MHYPYHEGKAGILRDRHRTADASEYLLADKEVVSLAKDLLTEEEYQEAEAISAKLTGTKREKDFARARLIDLVKPPPKRPIYYAQEELQYLPRWTRDALRYLGDFIDILVKSAVYQKTKKRSILGTSFGPAVNAFKEHWPDSTLLANFLTRYNRFLYRGAKHDFRLPAGRSMHRFTPREVVLTAYITMNLADKLTSISWMAQKVRNDEVIL